jgi:sugar phosphate isomerase/epimerase
MSKQTIDLLASYFMLCGDVYPLGPTEISPFTFKNRIESAAKAGFTGLGLHPEDTLWSIQKYGLREIKKMLADNGIKHLEIELLTGWFDKGKERNISDQIRQKMLILASELNIKHIKVAASFDNSIPDIPLIRDEFSSLCEQAFKSNTRIVLEIMPFSNVRTIETAVSIVESANQKNGGLLIDSWHLSRGNISFNNIAKIPSQFIQAVELSDARNPPPVDDLWEETLHHRERCGEGDLNIPDFIKQIKEKNYDGFYGVEILSEKHRKKSLDDIAQGAFKTAIAQFLNYD